MPLLRSTVEFNIIINFCIKLLYYYRRDLIKKWKEQQGLSATYRSLLRLFVDADHTLGAHALCEVLQKKGKLVQFIGTDSLFVFWIV